MKNKGSIFIALFALMMLVTSCEVIADIFGAGVGVGIFIAVLVVALIIWLITRFRKKT